VHDGDSARGRIHISDPKILHRLPRWADLREAMLKSYSPVLRVSTATEGSFFLFRWSCPVEKQDVFRPRIKFVDCRFKQCYTREFCQDEEAFRDGRLDLRYFFAERYVSRPTPTLLTPPRGIWSELHKRQRQWPS